MEKFNVMDIIAPLSESNELVLAIQSRDLERSISSFHSGSTQTIGLTATRCGALHVAVSSAFAPFIDYLLTNELVDIGASDAAGDTPLHYAARNGNKDIVAVLVARGADVLSRNNIRQTPMEVSTSIMVRQFLLPLQLQTESARGLAPVLPGVTTAPLNHTNHLPPPPPPPRPMLAAPPQDFASGATSSGTLTSPPPIWQPPRPDGFASSPIVSASREPQKAKGGAPPLQAPPAANQFSAYNAGYAPPSLHRYVAYGAPPHTVTAPLPPAPLATPYAQQPRPGDMEEVSLSPTSSSVM